MVQIKERKTDGPNPAAGKTFELELPVLFDQVDGNGHVNNKHYNSFCDEAVMAIFTQAGIDIPAYREEGLGPVVYKAEYSYLDEVFYGDTVKLVSRVELLKKTRANFFHDIYRSSDGALVCKATSFGIWMNLNTKRPFALPQDVIERLGGKK